MNVYTEIGIVILSIVLALVAGIVIAQWRERRRKPASDATPITAVRDLSHQPVSIYFHDATSAVVQNPAPPAASDAATVSSPTVGTHSASVDPAAPADTAAPSAGGGGTDVDAAHAALDAAIATAQATIDRAKAAKVALIERVTQATNDAHAAAKP